MALDPIISAIDAVQAARRLHIAVLADCDETDELSDLTATEAGYRWDRVFNTLLGMTPTTPAGLIALAQSCVSDTKADEQGIDPRNVYHLARAIEVSAAWIYLPKGTHQPRTLVEADPIFTAIKRHRDAWQAFQDAPDVPAGATFGDPEFDVASDAEDEEMNAGLALLGTTCATREGLAALLVHLDWYVAEERENLIRAAEHGAQYLALHANLQLVMGLNAEAHS